MHANQPALIAVLGGAERHSVDAVWCLGDLVGYGADPEACATACLDASARCIAGNHDLGLTGRIPLDVFSGDALAGLEHARRQTSTALVERLAGLEPMAPGDDGSLVHASPRDPIWEYIVSPSQAAAAIAESRTELTLHGHTHIPAAWRSDGDGGVAGGRWRGDDELALEDGPWLINPGAVGQPRDHDPRAAWALLDTEAGTIRLLREEYDIAAAQRAILAAELPPDLAARLEVGR